MNRDLVRRDLGAYALLTFVTIGLYQFWLVPSLARSVNHLLGIDRYSPRWIAIIGVLTLGIALIWYEIHMAYALQGANHYTRGRWSNSNLGGTVVVLVVIALVLNLVSGGLAIALGWVCSCAATWFIQREVNRVVDAELGVPAA